MTTLDFDACKALYDSASADSCRQKLQFARVGDGVAESTDGTFLVRRKVGDTEGVRFLHRNTLNLVKHGGHLELDTATGALALVDKNGTTMTLPNAPDIPSDGAYPSLDQLIPKFDRAEGVRFSLSGKMLKRLADIANREGGHSKRITIHVVDPERPFFWETSESHGVVCPLRLDPP